MLKPSMNELMAKVSSRYLLVNLAAQRARDLSEEYEISGEKMPDKSVKLALDEIAAGTIVYKDGPKPQPEPKPAPALPEDPAEAEVLDLDSFDEEEEEANFDGALEAEALFEEAPETAAALPEEF